MADSVKDKIVTYVYNNPYIVIAAIVVMIVVILYIVNKYGYLPKSSMQGRRRSGDIVEEELDELIDSVNKKQKSKPRPRE